MTQLAPQGLYLSFGDCTDGMFSLESESAFNLLLVHDPSNGSPLHSLHAIVRKVRRLHSLTPLASSSPFYRVPQQSPSVSSEVECPGVSSHSSAPSTLHSRTTYHLASARLPGAELDSWDGGT